MKQCLNSRWLRWLARLSARLSAWLSTAWLSTAWLFTAWLSTERSKPARPFDLGWICSAPTQPGSLAYKPGGQGYRPLLAAVLIFAIAAGCGLGQGLYPSAAIAGPSKGIALPMAQVPAQATSPTATAIFAGGCFWCMEQPFDELPGVLSTTAGYTGGSVENPSYSEVSAGGTGHLEAMQVRYDPTQVNYQDLLETYWHNIDPFDDLGQFCDKGSQYRSAIFYATDEQQSQAEASKAAIADKFNQPVVTEVLPAAPFYSAEAYHQDYYQTHPIRYKVYRFGCGRDQRLSDIWGSAAPAHP